MDQALQSGGIVGILVLLVLQQVFAFVQRRNGKSGENCALSKVCEMRHNAVLGCIERMGETLGKINDHLTAQTAVLQDMRKDVEIVKGKVT
jgi:hypothetical protein